jgi:NET1-associated nuclear protein 1 (U3 small nucleolar RNA-associated protein 17)
MPHNRTCLDWPAVLQLPSAHVYAMQCAAFDTTCTHVAAGDASGRIIIWSGLSTSALAASSSGSKERQDARTGSMTLSTLHWHARAVGALCFSSDGAYLLSAGEEATLVIWQLETLHKTFLPRLGGPVTRVVGCRSDPAKYAVSQEDNVIRVVSLATMQVRRLLADLTPAAVTMVFLATPAAAVESSYLSV